MIAIGAALADQLRRDLLTAAGHQQTGGQVIQEWELSTVQRLYLSDGSSVICKLATSPFTGEAAVLRHLNEHGAAVPHLHGYTLRPHALGMLMGDLGDPLRSATIAEAAAAASAIHAIPPVPTLPVFDQRTLARLPEQALAALDELHRQGRFVDSGAAEELLRRLVAVAGRRADGAEREPFGLCHGEFHRSSLHVSRAGCRLVDWAKAFTGPGLLDLATWFGTRNAADPAQLTRLIRAYVEAGGSTDAHSDRGGLPAAQWALGWHRVWAAWWFLTTAAAGHHRPHTDGSHAQVVHRQLHAAAQLLDAAPFGASGVHLTTAGRSL
ncbi:aminoglycoside phosphotransferase [Micromonospora sp. NBC_01739]|uniref:aminoglycoside phosphotransferase n=1 Tax=Micromonospora sp. NBC_01739 TaxID=2975985 RepID=UPI002E12282E|nr:aminoglycoside phosphotransferase family protein [Micromonospora sp. NBC_01739]